MHTELKLTSPPCAWISVETQTSIDNAIVRSSSEVLVLYPLAVNSLISQVGSRGWQILETMLLHSFINAEHNSARTYVGSLADLCLLAGRGEHGWSEETIRAHVQRLESHGLFRRLEGKRLGRKRGQSKTTWVLSDSLFLRASTVMPPIHMGTYGSGALSYGPTPTPLPSQHGTQLSGNAQFSNHHVDAMDDYPSILDGTDWGHLSSAVSHRLRAWGWTTNPDKAISEYGLRQIALWILYIQQSKNVEEPGGLLRSKLKEASTPPPFPGCDRNHAISVNENKEIVLINKEETALLGVPTVSELIEKLDEISETERLSIKESARKAIQIGNEKSTIAWRKHVYEELASRGVLTK